MGSKPRPAAVWPSVVVQEEFIHSIVAGERQRDQSTNVNIYFMVEEDECFALLTHTTREF